MGLYYKKMLVIEARQWGPAIVNVATEIIDWILKNGGTATFKCGRHCCDYQNGISIQTREGTKLAGPGDWILKGFGTFHPLKDAAFKATYEEVKT